MPPYFYFFFSFFYPPKLGGEVTENLLSCSRIFFPWCIHRICACRYYCTKSMLLRCLSGFLLCIPPPGSFVHRIYACGCDRCSAGSWASCRRMRREDFSRRSVSLLCLWLVNHFNQKQVTTRHFVLFSSFALLRCRPLWR